MLTRKEELLKLDLEHFRTTVYGLFAGALVIAFGVLSNVQLINRIDLVIGIIITTLILLVAFFVNLRRMIRCRDRLIAEVRKNDSQTMS